MARDIAAKVGTIIAMVDEIPPAEGKDYVDALGRLVSATQARSTALYPKNWKIAIGTDADRTILDQRLNTPVSADQLLSAQDYIVFKGFPVTGWRTHTRVGGRIKFALGKIVGHPDRRRLRHSQALLAAAGDLRQ